MENEWIKVFYRDEGWSKITVYVSPTDEIAKICTRECTYWGYHDESEWDDDEEIVSIERALAQVYPDEKAIAVILNNTKKDYSDTLKKLEERNTRSSDKADAPGNRKNTTPAAHEQTEQSKQTEAVPGRERADTQQKSEAKMMERKIQWISGCFDEIELVYNNASKNENIASILSELETGALAEARAYSDKIIVDGRPLTPQQFDALPDQAKEQVMSTLSTMGLASFSSTISEPLITVRLTPDIQKVRCCTAFSILNRLEKLDGAFNILHPTATLELQVPLGGKKGMFQIEYLIMQLYPWLQVREVSTNEVATGALQSQPQPVPQPTTAHKPEPAKTPAPAKSEKEQDDKPGFFARLFGKKKNTQSIPAEQKKADTSKNMSAEERFYHEMQTKPAFRNAFSCAIAEINSVIIKKQFNLKTQSGEPLTISAWQQFAEMEKLKHILAMGNYSIVPRTVLCVDFVEILPYCIAITLLYFAYTGQKENQILDTGDGADNAMLKIAVESLKSCYSKWQCQMFSL